MTDVKWNECMLMGHSVGLYLNMFFETDKHKVFANRIPIADRHSRDWEWHVTLSDKGLTDVHISDLTDDEYDLYKSTIQEARRRMHEAVESVLDEYN
jgi:hypothetical protein